MIQKMRYYCPKKAFTATNITLLPPLLPPLNTMKKRVLNLKVAVVAVKSIICLV